MPPTAAEDEQRKIRQLFLKVLNLDENSDLEDFSRKESSSWDSLRHAELILAAQKQFKIRFSVREILEVDSFRGFAAIVSAKSRCLPP